MTSFSARASEKCLPRKQGRHLFYVRKFLLQCGRESGSANLVLSNNHKLILLIYSAIGYNEVVST
jgi:hypothetical protein